MIGCVKKSISYFDEKQWILISVYTIDYLVFLQLFVGKYLRTKELVTTSFEKSTKTRCQEHKGFIRKPVGNL